MKQEYQPSCAFCRDRLCVNITSGRRMNFMGTVKTKDSDKFINDCPRFRKFTDFVSGKSPDMPSDTDPTD